MSPVARLPMIRAGVTILLAGLLGACSDPLDAERDAFRTARARWERAGIVDYVFDYQRWCFCGPDQTRRLRITVEGGEVVSAAYVDTNDPVADPLDGLPAIDDLFDVIRDAIRRDAYTLSAAYDEELGYPTGVSIDYRENVADEEMGFIVSAFERPVADGS